MKICSPLVDGVEKSQYLTIPWVPPSLGLVNHDQGPLRRNLGGVGRGGVVGEPMNSRPMKCAALPNMFASTDYHYCLSTCLKRTVLEAQLQAKLLIPTTDVRAPYL